jgi:nucleotide-binding universal stress UspA family protein
MTTILVLTDFSATAQVAMQYAGMLSRKLPARLILLHAVPRHSPWLGSVDDELVREARKKQEKLKEMLITRAIPASMLSSEVINHFPLDTVVRDFAKAEKVDLIVMGTRGVSAKGNAVLGSYTVEVMESSPVPVIAVPGDAPVTGISCMVYPSDLQQIQVEMEVLVRYARVFGAAIHVLHIQRSATEKAPNEAVMLSQLREKNGYERISFTVTAGHDLEEAIYGFTRDKNADLLAMFTRKKGFFEKIFSRSLTGQLGNYAPVPVFISPK